MRNTENPKLFWRNCLSVRQAGNIIICFSKYCLQIVSDGGGDKKGCSLLQISCSLESDLDEVLMPVSVISTGHLTRPEVRIGQVTISRNSSWIHLDSCLRGLVKTYLDSLDPEHSLELTSQSMVCYQCGNIRWQHFSFYSNICICFFTDESSKTPSLRGDQACCRIRGYGYHSAGELIGGVWRISPSSVSSLGLHWRTACPQSGNIRGPS